MAPKYQITQSLQQQNIVNPLNENSCLTQITIFSPQFYLLNQRYTILSFNIGLQQNLFLTVLDISHNKIKQLKNIKYLVNLTKLSAKNNQIQFLQQFDNLKSLNQIQLANNLITNILFAFPQSLKRINLQNNRIQSLQWISQLMKKKSSQQDKVQQINLKSNQIPQVMLMLVKSLLGITKVNIIV